MLIFSGATLPYEVMPAALQTVADILPLTQDVESRFTWPANGSCYHPRGCNDCTYSDMYEYVSVLLQVGLIVI